MMKAEYLEQQSFLQRDSAEHEGYAEVRSVDDRETKEQDGASLLEKILSRDNLNRAYKQVKSKQGSTGN